MLELLPMKVYSFMLTLLHSERPKLQTILAFLGATGLKVYGYITKGDNCYMIFFFFFYNLLY